ncbi:MAG: sensor histidine kinase [Planctomycetota bacterium]|jgi:signal transduction histidine kinase
MNRRWGVLAPALGLGIGLAALLVAYGLVSYRASRTHLDRHVAELGNALTSTAATSLRAADAVLRQLDGELKEGLRLKATYLDRATAESPRLLERFAFAARLRHVLVFDEAGQLIAHAQDLPDRRGAELGGTSALLDAVRQLLRRPEPRSAVQEIRIAAGGAPFIAHVTPLGRGGTAVLLQDASLFARTRHEAGPAAVAERLERETPIVFVRFNRPVPAGADAAVRVFESTLAEPSGTLRIGLDTSSMREALAIQLRGAILVGLLLWVAIVLGAVLVLWMRQSRAELARRVEHEERLSGLGRLAANIAHEVRNPLNSIGIAAQQLERREDLDTEVRDLATVVCDEVSRLDRTVNGVLQLARPGPARAGPVNVPALVETVAALARSEAEARDVLLEIGGSDAVELVGDTDLLRGALWNLVRNALLVSPGGKTVTLRASARNGDVELEVADQGPGLPPGDPGALFEPFRSGENGGSGLGLALALSAAQAHGGTIEAIQREEGGSIFRMRLPYSGGIQ